MGGACGAGKELGFTLGGAAGALGLPPATAEPDCRDDDSGSAGGAFAGEKQPAKTKAAMSGGKIDFGIPVMLVWPYAHITRVDFVTRSVWPHLLWVGSGCMAAAF